MSTYKVSVHEGQDPINPDHGPQPGWILVENGVSHMGLRVAVSSLRADGYDDSAILVEVEEQLLASQVSTAELCPEVDQKVREKPWEFV